MGLKMPDREDDFETDPDDPAFEELGDTLTCDDTSRDTSFGLEITPGDWQIEQEDWGIEFEQYRSIGPIHAGCMDDPHIIAQKDDAKAISAVPELLEVAEAAEFLMGQLKDTGRHGAVEMIRPSLEKLKEKLGG